MDAEIVKIIVQLLVVAGGGMGTAYGIVVSLRNKIESNADQMRKKMDENQSEVLDRVAEVKEGLSELDKRLVLVEQSMKQGGERFGEHTQDIREIRKTVHGLELDMASTGLRGSRYEAARQKKQPDNSKSEG